MVTVMVMVMVMMMLKLAATGFDCFSSVGSTWLTGVRIFVLQCQILR